MLLSVESMSAETMLDSLSMSKSVIPMIIPQLFVVSVVSRLSATISSSGTNGPLGPAGCLKS